MKTACAFLLLLVGGCSSCHDGQKENPLGGGLAFDKTYYSACNRGCVKKAKRCDCSRQCPCWNEHGTQAPPPQK